MCTFQCPKLKLFLKWINPLTALDVYIRPKIIAACIGYSASYCQNFEKPAFWF